ncbi:MAG: aminotransferase class III-fold pyridoxal phosphate-dependent enzyme [Gemmatimonadaceae bacterium]|nr:aminotransferase class III-fold pyridoxal phosphate-dependent enzyme [Gemmatimonadaceae bacterium]
MTSTMLPPVAPAPTPAAPAPLPAILGTYKRQAPLFVRGEGVYMIDETGKRYLDFVAGIAVTSLGHNDPGVNAAVQEALSAGLIHTSNLYRTAPGEALAQWLDRGARLLPRAHARHARGHRPSRVPAPVPPAHGWREHRGARPRRVARRARPRHRRGGDRGTHPG